MTHLNEKGRNIAFSLINNRYRVPGNKQSANLMPPCFGEWRLGEVKKKKKKMRSVGHLAHCEFVDIKSDLLYVYCEIRALRVRTLCEPSVPGKCANVRINTTLMQKY